MQNRKEGRESAESIQTKSGSQDFTGFHKDDSGHNTYHRYHGHYRHPNTKFNDRQLDNGTNNLPPAASEIHRPETQQSAAALPTSGGHQL